MKVRGTEIRHELFCIFRMRRKTSILVTAILLFPAACLTAGQGRTIRPVAKAQQKSSGGPTAAAVLQGGSAASAMVKRGKAEFLERCSFCHGRDALGASGPDIARSALVRQDIKGNLIAPVIRNGRPEKGMPPSHLSDIQIGEIVAFLHARAHEELFSFGLPKSYLFRTGNAKKGKTFFFGEGHCSSCHSPNRDLKGISSRYPPVTLMGLIAYPEGSAARTVNVTTKSGSSFSGRLVHLDEFTVSLRDKAGWIHSWRRKDVSLEVHDPLAEHKRLLQEYNDEELHDLFAYLESLK